MSYANPCACCGTSGGTITVESDAGAWLVMHESCFLDMGARWVYERVKEEEADVMMEERRAAP